MIVCVALRERETIVTLLLSNTFHLF